MLSKPFSPLVVLIARQPGYVQRVQNDVVSNTWTPLQGGCASHNIMPACLPSKGFAWLCFEDMWRSLIYSNGHSLRMSSLPR